MISPADPYIPAFAEAGADHIIVHPEAGPHLHRSLQLIRSLGKRAGVGAQPRHPGEWRSRPVLDSVDLVLVMTVNPGFGGQAFIASTVPKIAQLRAMIGDRPIAIEVDGGITAETAPRCIAAGATLLVAGTAVFGQPDRAAAIAELRRLIDPRRWARDARRVMARVPSLRMGRVPDAPALPVRDPWPGDADRGAQLLKGELEWNGAVRRLVAGDLGRHHRPRGAARARARLQLAARPARARHRRRPHAAPAPSSADWMATLRPRAPGLPAGRGRRAHHRLARRITTSSPPPPTTRSAAG